MDYRQIYNKIINRAKKEFSLGLRIKKKKGDPDYVYYEGHHIIPKCVGGEGSSKNWYHDNIVPLTPKEHFLAHNVLIKIDNQVHPRISIFSEIPIIQYP